MTDRNGLVTSRAVRARAIASFLIVLGALFAIGGFASMFSPSDSRAEHCSELMGQDGVAAEGNLDVHGLFFPLGHVCVFETERGGTKTVVMADWLASVAFYGGLLCFVGSIFALGAVSSSISRSRLKRQPPLPSKLMFGEGEGEGR